MGDFVITTILQERVTILPDVNQPGTVSGLLISNPECPECMFHHRL